MTLGSLLKYYATYQSLSVFELGGAPVACNVIASEIPTSIMAREIVRFYASINYICVTIEED